MMTKFRMPLVISVLGLALVLAACDRPSADTPINVAPTNSAQDVNIPPAQDPSAQQTADASGSDPFQPNAPATVEPTEQPPLPPIATDVPEPTAIPAESTPEPVVVNTPEATSPQSGCSSPYLVKTGEWLFSIGRTCNVNPYSIAQVNGIFPPYYIIYPGQQLIIPGGSTTPPPQAPPIDGTGNPGRTYVVQPGDNLFRIALSYGVSLQALAAANGLTNYNLIFVGRTLIIP